MRLIYRYFENFISLIFPRICHACGEHLVKTEAHFCGSCILAFPYTDYHLYKENKLAKQFWGTVKLESAAAFLFFNTGSKVQNIMHQLKYNNQPQIGIALGQLYGQQLKTNMHYQTAEAIIPVPLHPKKILKRGYNQSEQFAIGLAQSLNIPVITDLLLRDKFAESQTTKSRLNRFDNMDSVFRAIADKHQFKKVLLVDDTITTGATLAACATALQDIGIKEINIVGIAFAG
jgi:ComF family protein